MIYSRSATVLLALATILVAPPLRAQTDTSTSTTTSGIQKSDFSIRIMRQDGDSWVYMTDLEKQTMLNQAHCLCETPVRVRVEMVSESRSKLGNLSTGSMRLLIGLNNCLASGETDRNAAACYGDAYHPDTRLYSNNLGQLSKAGYWEVDLTTRDLFTRDKDATGTEADCTRSVTQNLWFWINTTGGSIPELNDGAGGGSVSLALTLDGTPPPAPTGLEVKGGNEALEISWAAADTTSSDLAGYLLFCTRTDSLQVFSKSFYDDQYFTRQTTCGTDTTTSALTDSTSWADSTSQVSSVESPAVAVGAPAPIAALDKAYMCSGLISAQTTSFRLATLQNGVPYTVGLAAVDTLGNASVIDTAYVQTPIPTRDFYREYRDAGGQAKGGYCTLAGRRVRPSGLVLGALGLGTAWLLRRRLRRRTRRGGKGLFLLLPLLVSTQTQAQTITHDFDDMGDMEQLTPQSFRSPRYGAFELRFGPYSPDIDSELSGTTGATPYKTVMGGNSLMSQFELDWEILHSIGTLGVGVQAGYTSKTAKAFVADANGASTGERSGDDTTLRLMPVAALLIYRMDLAAEYWGIPLVPYAKVGLNYTFWSISDGNGNTPHYMNGKGKGGTLGWQAAVGLALQLDFLDPGAARGFDTDLGVNHTYLFFEWDRVVANGLGQENKLHVGDNTWVAGLMFEF